MENPAAEEGYRDVGHERAIRAAQATGDLTLLYDRIEKTTGMNFTRGPQHILEIGSGQGGVTKALRILVPTGRVTAIDYDTNPEVVAAAKLTGAELIQRDVTAFSPDAFNALLKEKGVTQIVALRTSPRVAKYLTDISSSGTFAGPILLSLVQQSERQPVEELTQKAREGKCERVPIREGRGILGEQGFVFLPPVPAKE